ncbi:substrate-binding domain-containing protein [Candidatus Bathyarchaeota archaeon]|nr:substrate-binding domain-containing protein [Candidatus Bathyarchaeota archaeon]
MLLTATITTTIIIAGTFIYLRYFAKKRLIISTTTSLDETGLLGEIKKAFEEKCPITLNFIPVGTGIAIEQAKRGEMDLTLVHSPTLEKTFLEQGYGVCRKIIAYNFFTIIGPKEDPAGIGQLNVTEALKRIVEYGRTQTRKVWISRGDNSGTHQKEQNLWKIAGYNYTLLSKETWYEGGGGKMGDTLFKAEEFSAYALSDTGTYLKYFKDNRISLQALITEEKVLLNVYSVIAVNPMRYPDINFNDTITFMRFLISNETQQLIENYGKSDYGRSLFYAAVEPLKQNSPQPIVQWIKDYAYFNESECPQEHRCGQEDLYD